MGKYQKSVLTVRILHLTPQLGAGGAERQLVNLVTALRRFPDVKQHIAVIYHESVYPFFFRDELQEIPTTFLNKRVGKFNRLVLLWRYWQLIRQFQPDIVHAHQWYAMNLARVFHRWMFRNVNVIAHSQNMLNEWVDNERRYAHLADKIITVSPPAFEEYRTLIPHSEPSLVMIPNAVDTNRYFPASQADARQRLNISQQTILGLFPARITPQKNHLGLLKAVKRLIEAGQWPSHAQILCLGENHDDAYYEQVMEIGESRYVQIHPPVHNIADYYHACDFLILPSFYEGLSLTLLEASACARPALVSERANSAGVIENGHSGWVVSADENSLREGLREAFSATSVEREMMGQNAHQQVVSRYNIERIAQEVYDLYKQLLAE